MERTAAIIKEGFKFGKKESILSLCVFLYLLFSAGLVSSGLREESLVFLQIFLVLAENYVTVAVYYGIKRYLWGDDFAVSRIFVEARHFFFRVLGYKFLAGFFALLLLSFCLSMIELVKSASLAAAGLITGFTLLWIAFPVYLLILTFLTPLIIITDDSFLFPSIRKSLLWTRDNISEIISILLVMAPLWLFAFYFVKAYTKDGLSLISGVVFYLIAVLEIITIKIFLLLYKKKLFGGERKSIPDIYKEEKETNND